MRGISGLWGHWRPPRKRHSVTIMSQGIHDTAARADALTSPEAAKVHTSQERAEVLNIRTGQYCHDDHVSWKNTSPAVVILWP